MNRKKCWELEKFQACLHKLYPYFQEMDEKDKTNSFNDDGTTGGYGKNRKPRRLFDADNRALNVNEANIDFHYNDSSDEKYLIIELKTYKHLDSSYINLDVEPWYLR